MHVLDAISLSPPLFPLPNCYSTAVVDNRLAQVRHELHARRILGGVRHDSIGARGGVEVHLFTATQRHATQLDSTKQPEESHVRLGYAFVRDAKYA